MVVVQVASHAFPAASQVAFRACVALGAYRVAFLACRVEEVEMAESRSSASPGEEASSAFQVEISFRAASVAFHEGADHLAFGAGPICQVADGRYSMTFHVLLLDLNDLHELQAADLIKVESGCSSAQFFRATFQAKVKSFRERG